MKPFLKSDDFTDEQRLKLYGVTRNDFTLVAQPEEADVAILTMTWNYYIKTGKKELAVNFINSASILGKKILINNAGDYGVKMPFFPNAVVFRSGGYKSRLKENERIIPPFIKDPLSFGDRTLVINQYKKIPRVGFCGQANLSQVNALKEIMIAGWRNFKYYTAQTLEEPQQLISSSFLRAQVLEQLKTSSLVETKFIFREKYRAGVKKDKELHKTSREFFGNIAECDYTVCLRGVGNFSVRFYETLAMGRIPIYVNMDGALPFEEKIEWSKHVVWIEVVDLPRIAEEVIKFHRKLDAESFAKLQEANRRIWKEYFGLKGFFKEYYNEQFNV